MFKYLVTICLALSFSLVMASSSRAEEPVAGVSFQERSIAAGIGYSWGAGTLHFKGKNYPFKVTGLAVGQAGAEDVTATGSVYRLEKVSDFSGNYTAASSGLTLGGGMSGTVMRNENGVAMVIRATTQGLEAKIATEGLKVTLE